MEYSHVITDERSKKWVQVTLAVEIDLFTDKVHNRLRIKRSDGSEDNVEPFLAKDDKYTGRQLTQMVYSICQESLKSFLAPPVPTVNQKALSVSRQAKWLLRSPMRVLLLRGVCR